ncbi:hypothetical protein IV203_013226 [Nitzschia inconspicua]|uniref:BED-type domain-containing protein n=1 Tax=Nitzschia inconspicua TaxID=303405 RepID=A0A9K3M8I5_9STRA|nr:hypothetical protein IV203_013226 [Nitzschia inconspicua]
MSKFTIPGKFYSQFFFDRHPQKQDYWVCKRCKLQNKPLKQNLESGYSNLVKHAKICYGDDLEEEFAQRLADAGMTREDLEKIVKTGKTEKITTMMQNWASCSDAQRAAYGWLRIIVNDNLPLTIVDSEDMRMFSKHDSITPKTIRKYIINLSILVRQRISTEVRKAGNYALVHDGWTCDGTSIHYIAIFASYIEPGEPGKEQYKEVLLGISPPITQSNLGADSHIELLQDTINKFGLLKEDLICLVGDNCNCNKAISDRWGVPMVGCASHRLALAVDHWIESTPGLADAIAATAKLMSKASGVRISARLRNLTEEAHGKTLAPKKKNETRWTSTYTMLERWFRIKDQSAKVEDLEEYQLSFSQSKIIESSLDKMKKLDLLTTKIQETGLPLSRAREMFNYTLNHDPSFQCMDKYLGPMADIVKSKVFESAIVKISNGNMNLLTQEEKATVSKLKRNADDNNTGREEEDGTFEAFEAMLSDPKRFKSNAHDPVNGIDDRRSMSPLVFEAILFLKKNVSFWDIQLVATAMRMTIPKEQEEIDDDMHYGN